MPVPPGQSGRIRHRGPLTHLIDNHSDNAVACNSVPENYVLLQHHCFALDPHFVFTRTKLLKMQVKHS